MVADDFTYQYSGNKLASLNNGTYTYAYDANGNCITDGLKNLELKYNFLNLITQVGRASSVKATYRWTADGAKNGVIGEDGRGFEYLGSLIYQYVNGQLQLESAAFGGGRIVATHGSNGTSYTPNHFITDHLGSVRVVVDGSGQVLERNDYYAFGSRWENPASPVSGNRYRFNGKELQTTAEVNYLDYGARMYDQRLGRWHSVDPLAEKYYSISPYVYCNNNPVNVIDPDGRDWYTHFQSGATFWQEGNTGFVERDGQRYDNIGSTYIQYLLDGTTMGWDQQELSFVRDPQSFTQGTRSFWEKFSRCDDFFVKLGYNIANDLYVTMQPLTFNLFTGGGRINELTGGHAYVNLDGTTNYNAVNALAGTITLLTPAMGKMGSSAANVWEAAAKGGVQYTKSSLKMGQEMHKAYKVGAEGVKEFRLPSGKRIDFLDIKNSTIYELKPFNPRGMQQGQIQLNMYMQELQTMPRFQGVQWKTVLDFY